MKTQVRYDKKQYIQQIAEAGGKAVKNNDLRELYHIIRLLSRNLKITSDLPIEAKDEILLTAQTDINNRWMEPSTELLNRPSPNEKFVFDLTSPIKGPYIEIAPITKAEIIKAISSIKNNKAPRIDEIPGELLKVNEPTAINGLVNFYNKFWNDEKIPKKWKIGVIIKISKKKEI